MFPIHVEREKVVRDAWGSAALGRGKPLLVVKCCFADIVIAWTLSFTRYGSRHFSNIFFHEQEG